MKLPFLNPLAWLLALAMLLTGCASTLKSEVVVFHEWPQQLPDKSFAIDETPGRDDLQYRFYADLVRAKLRQLGFTDEGATAKLKVFLHYSSSVRDVQEIYPVRADPFWPDPLLLHRHWPGHAYASPYHDPFFIPQWAGLPYVEYRESRYLQYTHQLKINMVRVRDGKLLYDVTVDTRSRTAPLATAMPYLVQSAFSDFPGKSGVARQVELNMAQ